MATKLIILGIVLAFLGAVALEAFIRRHRERPTMAARFKLNHGKDIDESKPELGMEATDMKVVIESERLSNNIEQRNRNLTKR